MLMLMLMLPYVACFFGLHYMLVHAVALCRPLQARRAGRGALAKGTLHLDGPQSTVGPCQQQLLLMQQLFTERGGGGHMRARRPNKSQLTYIKLKSRMKRARPDYSETEMARWVTNQSTYYSLPRIILLGSRKFLGTHQFQMPATSWDRVVS